MSFCFIPNLCSSSTTRRPVFEKLIPDVKRACVPIKISTFPLLKLSTISSLSFFVTCLLIIFVLTARDLNLSKKDS